MAKIARSFELGGEKVARFSLHRKGLTLFLCLALTFLAGFGAKYLKFSGDFEIYFGSENPELKNFLNFEATFGKADNITFVVIPKSGNIYEPRVIEAVHDITTQAWNLPYVSRVDSLTNFQHTIAEGDDLIVEDLIFDKSEIFEEGQMERLQSVAINEPLLHQFVTSPEGQATIVNAVIQVDRKIAEDVLGASMKAREIRDMVMADYPEIEIKLTGANMLSAAFTEVAMSDAASLTPIMYGLIIVVMLIVFRSLLATLISLFIVILSTIFGMGTGGWLGIELTPISMTAMTVILTIAIADAVHVLSAFRQRMQRGMEKSQAIIEATASNCFPITLTSLTTVVGFLSLNFSDSPPFHHLGNITAAGIFMAWVLSLTFLPALLQMMPVAFKAKANVGDEPRSFMLSVGRKVESHKIVAFAGTTVFCLLAMSLMPRIEFNDVWSKYFAPSVEIRQSIDRVRPYFGTDTIEFVVDSGASQNVLAPDFLADVEAFAGWLKAQDAVAHVYAVSDIMKRLNKNLNGDEESFYRIPDNRKLASQYLLVYELSLPYGLDLNDRIDLDRRYTRVTARIKDVSTVEARTLLENAVQWMDENTTSGAKVQATGATTLFNYIADRNIESMFKGALVLIAAIFIIMTISFKSLGIGFLSVVLNSVPILATFGIWAVVSGTVGFSIAVVGAVAIGLVIDDTVHLISKYMAARRHKGLTAKDSILYAFDTAGTAIVATTLILTAGFALLATSVFKPNQDMGILTSIAIILAMFINFLVMPALLSLFDTQKKETLT